MAGPILTIRNLTSTPVEFKQLERLQNVSYSRCLYSFCKDFIGMTSNNKTTSSSNTALSRKLNNQKESFFVVAPFETKVTEIERNPDELLQLTFEVNGRSYQIKTSERCPGSIALTSLTPDSSAQIIAIHHPETSHLSLFSTAPLDSWMSSLSDEIPLSALSIPGTHNSPTCHLALPSVRCQAVSISEQLNHGIRFLDIRVQPEDLQDPSKDRLSLVHGVFPISLTGPKYFRSLLKAIYAFLDAHPTEAIILSLKREGTGKATDEQLSQILHKFYANDKRRWFTDTRIPKLGEVRSKIVLIRRFNLDDALRTENDNRGWAIDATCWPDNCADGICCEGAIRIQDFYEVSESSLIKTKMVYAIEQLTRSARTGINLGKKDTINPHPPFFINFLSASNFWRTQCWPDRVASIVNPYIVDHLCRNHSIRNECSDEDLLGNGCTGIVVCDWVGKNDDWDLVTCIVGMNELHQLR
ncbi:unnamed protein product [Blumeria hordei]|uniref:Phosphatidylinositol-specific phospholipase C X domain-containing protein n=2 Tax=Blumeria hordei TaxID=2867405 RepID=A0A383URX5_BLUHO|nr:1-phosphatidylinositol phosphodiesterase precursor [Blumeria hordei DH14]SZF02526.1 unnamed protein product [Blumeria hordei]